jgi:hypothetical protein
VREAAGCRQHGVHVVSRKVVIRDKMAVREPGVPTRGSRMSHCSRRLGEDLRDAHVL